MNVHVRLQPGWTYLERVAVKGCAFLGDNILSGKTLAEYFKNVDEERAFMERLQALNGFFSVTIQLPGKILAAVDRVRSYPLFYSQQGRVLYLSDDPYWIQEELGQPELDLVSAAELLLAGYVTGSHTLDPRIAQLQPGELLMAKDTGSGMMVNTSLYYRFCHHDPLPAQTEQLLDMHDHVVQAAVKRLLHFADGRLIAIPLSGGRDSRLIAMTLKRLGYDNICAYSYGLPGNAEAEVSHAVAREIGIPWHFVPYSRDMWAKLHASKEWQAYIRFAERLTSLAHLQDWPAVMQLRAKGVLGEGTVIAPGHSADFLAGKQIPPALLRQPLHGLPSDAVARAVWKRHYNLQSIASVARLLRLEKRQLSEDIRKRLESHFQAFDLRTPEGRVDAFDYEFWQEWLSKVLVNSMRVYEFWGLDWWLPWYDAEYVAFWERVPLEHRLHKALYNNYVESIQRALGITTRAFDPPLLKAWAKSCISRLGLEDLVYKLYWYVYRRRHDYFGHPLAWYGIVDYKTYSHLLRQGGSFNTLITYEQIRNHLSMNRRSSDARGV